MNTYDPMDRIVYRDMDQRRDAYSVAVANTRSVIPLPSGCANQSPRTYLGRTGRTARAA